MNAILSNFFWESLHPIMGGMAIISVPFSLLASIGNISGSPKPKHVRKVITDITANGSYVYFFPITVPVTIAYKAYNQRNNIKD